MAQGDRKRDPDTGETFVENAVGELVLGIEALPGAATQAAMSVQALVGGIGSGLLDNILLARGVTDITAAGLGAIGAESAATSLRGVGQDILDIRKRVQPDLLVAQQAAFPLAFGAGEVVGGIKPGGPAVQAAVGLVQGVGFGESPAAQLLGGGLGLAGGLVGARQGTRFAQARALRQLSGGDAAQQARGRAISKLDELGIPLTETNRTIEGTVAHGTAETRDRLRQLLNPGFSARTKRDALNEVITDTVLPGNGQNAITRTWMTQLFDKVDELYAGVRSSLPKITRKTDLADAEVVRMLDNIADVRIDQQGRVMARAEQVFDEYTNGKLSPRRWTQLRSSIARDARSAHRIGEWETAEALYNVRQSLDNIVTSGEPGTLQALNEANELFRFREVLDSANVINRELDINPGAFLRNMEKMFPQVWRSGSKNPKAAETMYTAVAAAEFFPEFRSSGTGEMLNASGLTKRAQQNARLAAGSKATVAGGTAGRGAANILTEQISGIPQQIIDSFRSSFGE